MRRTTAKGGECTYCGGVSNGNALTICCPAQAAEGASVTAKCSTFLRSCARITKTKRTRKVTVGTVKKSTAMRCFVWLARNDRHECEGGPRSPFGRYFRTVAAET
jgi:hypothetical protein